MSDLGKKNEAETSLIDRCGYCSRPKRPGKSTQNSHLCQCPSASDSKDPSMRLGTVPSSAFRSSTTSVPQATTVAETNIGLGEIVSVREKHGYFRKAIPQLPMSLAVLLCLLNVLVPGLGTLLSILGVLCGCKTDYGCKRRSSLITLLAAFLQLLTAPLIVGWIWSVLWGITFVNISANRDEDAAPTNML